MPSKDITLLIAHPDDEVLWCWPVLDRVERIICASSDQHNHERIWCKDRRLCLEEVGQMLGASVKCFDSDSEFFRLPARAGELKAVAQDLLTEMQSASTIFTHNPWGEYGHLDHILCHQIARISGMPVMTTDIAIEINWLPIRAQVPGRLIGRAQMDQGLYDRLKALYDARGCWTWSFPPVTECGVFAC